MRTELLAPWLAFGMAGSALGQGEPEAPLTIPHILQTPMISRFRIAPDGKRVALDISVLGKETIYVLGGDQEDVPPARIATQKAWGERDVDWSPDGRSIAFVSNRAGGWHLHVSDAAGENAKRLTKSPYEARSPRWAPDGKQIVFLAKRANAHLDTATDTRTNTGWDLWTLSIEDGTTRQLTREPFDEEDPQWSPDGRKIAFAFNQGHHQNGDVGLVGTDGEASLERLTPAGWTGDSFGARWSPDGSRIAFVSDQLGKKAVFIVSSRGGEPERLREADHELYEPAWSPDGQNLAYLENRDGDVKLKVYHFETKRDRVLTLRNGVHTAPAWLPDGSAVAGLFEAWNYPRDVWSYPIEGGRTRVSDTLPPDLDVRKMVRPELIRYRSSDNLEVTGYLYLPQHASADTPVPLLVRPHGGPTSQWQNKWYPFVQLLAQKGFAVFAPNVRGSTGFGVAFEDMNDGDWGRGDLEDLVSGTRLVARRPEIRSNRIGIWGVSYGGFLTLAAIARHPDMFVCAVEAVGMPDLERLYRQTTDEGRSYLDREIGPLRGNLQLYRDLSPIRAVDDIKTPLLSFHGEVYPLVPYSTKQPFLDALRNRPAFPLVDFVFKGEEARATYRHDLHPEAAWAYVEKILEFLEIYL